VCIFMWRISSATIFILLAKANALKFYFYNIVNTVQ
jgi:hypothetical protein